MSAILGTAATLRFDGVAGFDCLHGTPRLIQPDNINQTLKIWLNGGHFPFAFSASIASACSIFSARTSQASAVALSSLPCLRSPAASPILRSAISLHSAEVNRVTISSPSARSRPGGGWLRDGREDRPACGANRRAALPCRVERE